MLSPLKLFYSVKTAKHGDFIEYYKGHLAIDADERKRSIQKASYLLYEKGLILLVTKKLREGVYSYYAVRTKIPYNEDHNVLEIIKKLERQSQ